MIVVGIDPGISGAIAIITGPGEIELYDMPTISEKTSSGLRHYVDSIELYHLLSLRHIDRAAIERVSARPGQGVASMFAFGRAYGECIGVLSALGAPFALIQPKQWQRIAAVEGGAEVKANARRRATELFPAYAHHFAKVKHSGRADAALIAYSVLKCPSSARGSRKER